MSDPLLHAIIHGNPLDLPGLGSSTHDGGLTILFPLSFGNTVGDLANALKLPVDSILAVNPGLHADSPLSVSQVVGLPDDKVEQIVQSVGALSGRVYPPAPVTAPPPSPPAEAAPPPYAGAVLNVNATVPMPALHSVASELNLTDQPRQLATLIAPADDAAPSWTIQAGAYTLQSADDPPVTVATPQPTKTPPPIAEPSSSEPVTTPTAAPNSSDNVTLPASGQPSNPSTANRVQATHAPTRSLQIQQRTQDSTIPPPPIDPRWFTAQPIVTPASDIRMATPMVFASANTSANPNALRLMALLMAQSSASLAAGGSTTPPPPLQPTIDPQALAAFMAATRGNKVVDLGAGRSMEFSLVRDRLQRIDPIGQEDRATPGRRSGDGLEEVRVGRPEQDDVEQTDEQREQGRRRRAAIAAMRRRRRPRSRRCRYWRGSRSILRSAGMRYPKNIDWAEFRSRQLPRYG